MNRPCIVFAGAIALVSLSQSAIASDCAFFADAIKRLEVECANGRYCEDLRAHRQHVIQLGCVRPPPQQQQRQSAPMTPRQPPPAPPPPPPPPRQTPRKPPQDQARCVQIPEQRASYNRVITDKVTEKLKYLREGLADLKKYRAELEKDYRWRVGDRGSLRELATYLALTTKTTTNLISGLSGFGALNNSGALLRNFDSEKLLRAIDAGQDIKAVLGKSGEELLLEASVILARDLHPVGRAAGVLKTFGEDIHELAATERSMTEARNEYRRVLAGIDRQIEALVGKIEQARQHLINQTTVEMQQLWLQVRNACLSRSSSGSSQRRMP